MRHRGRSLLYPITWFDTETGAVLGKNIWGALPLIIWEATTAEQNYYRTNYIKHVEKLGLNYPEKNLRGLGKI